MSVAEPGTRVPDFTLRTEKGEPFTQDDLAGHTTVLVFFPNAFSPVCTDQFNVYQEVLSELEERGARIYGVSCDQSWTLREFRRKLGVDIPMLSDFEPKGELSKALGVYFEPAGFSNRALVVVGPDLEVKWRYVAPSPGDLPGVNFIFDGLQAAGV